MLPPQRLLRWRAPAALALASLAIALARGAGATRGDARDGVAGALARRGLTCGAGDVQWVRADSDVLASVVTNGRALVRARGADESHDLYWVEVHLSPEGRFLRLGDVYAVATTPDVDEERPLLRGARAAYVTRAGDRVTAVHVLDLDGRSPAAPGLTRTQIVQAALTQAQATGQARGIVHHVFALPDGPAQVTLTWVDDARLSIVAGPRARLVDAASGAVLEGKEIVRATPDERAPPPSLAPWAVDRLRAVSFIGEDRMQLVKAVAFTGLEWAHDASDRALGDDGRAGQDDWQALGGGTPAATAPREAEASWPPPPMVAVFPTPLPGEGTWTVLDSDAFVTPPEGEDTGHALVTSFVRTDRQRPNTRIWVTLWDPRRIALHMEAGTVEPQSTTGAKGPGLVPRTADGVGRLVGAFNGGFQALHGEFGMQAQGVSYLPPKPYAATVLELEGGATAFGSWPADDVKTDGVVSFRQNLTALVEGGQTNPWGRTWWGGTPKGWSDSIHTTRSGTCRTREGFAGYFWGVDVSPEALAKGMLAARCTYGVHLDMNPGLAGFELYRVAEDGKLPTLGRPLQSDWEAEGEIEGMPGMRFRARRMVKSMQHMNFPQYVRRVGRDFFYLTRRPTLPPRSDTRTWQSKGLPQHGFPAATAIAREGELAIVRVDPRAVRVEPAEAAPTVLAITGAALDDPRGGPPPGSSALVLDGGAFQLVAEADRGARTALVRGGSVELGPKQATAAVGIRDADGMLEWVEAPGGAAVASKALDAILEKDGCSRRMIVAGEARVLLGGTLRADGGAAPAPLVGRAIRLVRAPALLARPHFTGTKVVPASVWQHAQGERRRSAMR